MNFYNTNKRKRRVYLLAFFIYCISFNILLAQDCTEANLYQHPIAFDPQIYLASYTSDSLVIDGFLNESSWQLAEYSERFVDIEGAHKPQPERETKIKIVWDSSYLYIGAILEEDHIWATLKNKDDIIYHDDDFEVFIDADGDGHNYHEFEMNAFNTIWDLWIMHPYSVAKSRNYIMEWEAKGWETAVQVKGTINDPSDTDEYWAVEMKIPLHLLGRLRPFWRINFSRVDWLVNVEDNGYVKKKGVRERNWVWSPTGFVDMHKPETWGYLFFDQDDDLPDAEYFKWEMWKVYKSIVKYKRLNGHYPKDLKCISKDPRFKIESTSVGFDLFGNLEGEKWYMNESARISKIN